MRWRSMLVLLIVMQLPYPDAFASDLAAGVARIDLTPPMEMGATLGGYGARMSRPAEGVHDRVFAKALVLSNDTGRFALVTADVLGFPPPVKRAVLEQLSTGGWSDAQVMLLPSHSHTSIDMMQIHPGNVLPIPQLGLYRADVYEWTVKNLVQVIRNASRNQVPIAVGTEAVVLPGWNANRRRAGGAVDNRLTVTRIDKRDGEPLAVLVNWTAHPTFMSAEDMMFSGGWPGHLQRTLEALIDRGVTVMYYNGAEGDQRPIARPNSGGSSWERAERYGRELALEAHRAFGRVRPRADVSFAYHRQPIKLPDRTVHPDYLRTGGKEYGLTGEIMNRLLSTITPPETYSGSLRLGDLVIVGVPGELTAELGLQIKKRARELTGASFPTIGGLANEWVSYILSREEYARGGYEASVSFYGPTLGETIVEGAVAGVQRLRK